MGLSKDDRLPIGFNLRVILWQGVREPVPAEHGERGHRLCREPFEHRPRSCANHPCISSGLVDQPGHPVHIDLQVRQRFRDERDLMAPFVEPVAQFL